MVEHGSNKPRVLGSSPSMTSVFFANQGFDSVEGSMVERSNTLVLGTNLFGGLGSNPSRVILVAILVFLVPGADWRFLNWVTALISFSSLVLFRVV